MTCMARSTEEGGASPSNCTDDELALVQSSEALPHEGRSASLLCTHLCQNAGHERQRSLQKAMS